MEFQKRREEEGVPGTDISTRQQRPGNMTFAMHSLFTKHYLDGLTLQVILTNAHARRVNPGAGNPITASVRETYGTAHQVVL